MEKNLEMYDASYVLSNFNTARSYEKFVMDRADYQKELAQIKHLILHR